MKIFILFVILLLPSSAFGQSYEGSYRAVFFNLFSGQKMIVAEFAVKADNSLSGKIKIDESVKTFSGTVDKKGKFEAVVEQSGNYVYKLKGKFDKDNKISLVQRNQTGSGLNRSVSESALEGNFSKIVLAETNSASPTEPKTELTDNGQSWLKIEHSEPLFGTNWTDFSATVGFGNTKMTPLGSESKKITGTSEASDYFVVQVKSKIEGQQALRINVSLYAPDKKVWRQNELRAVSYREVKGEQRNSFLAGATLQTDPRYADGKMEIVRETGTQIVFKLTNFKIKKLTKEDFATLNGFIYADK
jgi:hypothetical protein